MKVDQTPRAMAWDVKTSLYIDSVPVVERLSKKIVHFLIKAPN